MHTLFLTHPDCLNHDTGFDHPENADRLKAIYQALESSDFTYLIREQAPRATIEQLARVHSLDYIESIFSRIPEPGHYYEIDGDTILSSGSGEAALRSAGAVCAAVDTIMAHKSKNSFCAIRPPGHHADRAQAMGFCLFNNIVIGAMHARKAHKIKKIAIIDFDVHHGNGTQNIIWDKADFFYGSTHQKDIFPWCGDENEKGGLGGATIVNVPLQSGSGVQQFRSAYQDYILPSLRSFAPDFLFLSAGYDAHILDSIASLKVERQDFDWLTEELISIAHEFCQGRIVSVLEGGYNLSALSSCVASHIKLLMQG
jgi:acetoin utilization deacetylase AcuC-like enzyme